jgi:hypothetical protein
METRLLLFALMIFPAAVTGSAAASIGNAGKLETSIDQLRYVAGEWSVATEELTADGAIARTLEGSYTFDWVIPDRVLSGRSEIPEVNRVSAVLFYVNETQEKIEMVSVGADGRLWVMSGKLGEETRYTEPFATQDGGTAQLRFTRYNVRADTFESKMEYSEDGGKSWMPGNHQTFIRR